MTDRTEYLKAYNAAHREERKAAARAHPEWARNYRERNKDKIRAAAQSRNPARNARLRAQNAADPERHRERKRRASIGIHHITVEQYEAMAAAQDGRCAICRRPSPRLQIDHDHRCCPGRTSCGRCVRGLLCLRCNIGLGRFDDDPDLIRAAADYLDRPLLSLGDRLQERQDDLLEQEDRDQRDHDVENDLADDRRDVHSVEPPDSAMGVVGSGGGATVAS